MPTNKNAQFRYRVIDRCLQNRGREWTLQDLIDEISDQMGEQFGNYKGISKRTVQYDINLMRSEPPRGFDAPIGCEDSKYFYEDPAFSIIDHPLIDSDIEQIQEAITILKQFKGLPHFKGLEQVIYKIEGQANTYGRQEFIHFERNEDVAGLKWLENLYNSILNQQVLEIEYQSFKAEISKKEVVHPYLLKEYRNRWFLLGYNENFELISNYALDRIIDIQIKNKKFRENTDIDPDSYFCNIIGVSVPEDQEPIEIKFWASLEQAPYLVTKPIHHSQKILEENKDGSIFQIYVIPNFELEQVFLGFGERVNILDPQWWSLILKERIKNALRHYR